VGKALLIAPVNSEWAPEEHLRHSSFKSATPAVAFKEYQAAGALAKNTAAIAGSTQSKAGFGRDIQSCG
jgi:hypothetical protein